MHGCPWDEVRALELPVTDYVIFGSAPLLAHGLVAQIGDIDLLARRSAWAQALKFSQPERAPNGDSVIHASPALDIYNGWLGLDVDGIIRRSALIDGLPIAALSDVAVYKRILGRPKDRAHLELLSKL